MDKNIDDNFIDDYEDALNSVPEEVRDFLWSDHYKGYINSIAKYCNLNDTQKTIVSDVLFDVIIEAIDEMGARSKLSSAGILENTQDTIFSIAYDYLINTATQITEEKLIPEKTSSASNTNNTNVPLTTLADRLKQASIASPSTRDYTLSKGSIASNTSNVSPEATRAIDPYHEPVDND